MAGKQVFDEVTERLWPDHDHGPFKLTLYWVRKNGRPEVVGMQLLPYDASRARTLVLMTSTLRELKIAEIAADEREHLEHVPAERPTPEVRVAGMRPATVKRLERVAAIYQTAWRAGDSPTQAVSRRLNVTAASAANLVRRAREAGFLPPTSAGIPQG